MGGATAPTTGDRGPARARGPLGRQGLVVSDQGLGCMGLHATEGPDAHAEAVATVDRALDWGVTFFDTADVYGPHVNEELVGDALRSAP